MIETTVVEYMRLRGNGKRWRNGMIEKEAAQETMDILGS